MTSKHLFFKAMKEDFRHKIWMIALSTLGSFLALPVSFLILRSNEFNRYGDLEGLLQQSEAVIQQRSEWIFAFFTLYLLIVCGILGILGAIITGLFGFRYVFHQNMVDTYHSMPVKRRTLYGACYVNGILVWLIPFLVCLVPSLIIGCTLIVRLGRGAMLGDMMQRLGVNLLILLVIYLEVYHLVLIAVMLSGNTLNTLVSICFLGFGAISLYTLGIVFQGYRDTFYLSAVKWDWAIYASPFLSALYLLVMRVREARSLGTWVLWRGVLPNAGMAAALGAAAWFLYRARASETAGQGIGNRIVAACFRIIMGVAAGMGGWGLFILLVSNSRALGWGIFGAVLAAVLVFGVLDIIFQMDFKAFFSHKMQMAVTVALGLVVCFNFYWDWMGYDSYLPDKDEIVEIAVYDTKLSNQSYNGAAQESLEGMHFQDGDVIYAYLEGVTALETGNGDLSYDEYDRVVTRITLENGRSYYRNYRVTDAEKELFWPIITSEEFLKHNWLIDERFAANCVGMSLNIGGEWENLQNDEKLQEIVLSIARAYNQDVQENVENVLLGRGRIVAAMELECLLQQEDSAKRKVSKVMNLYVYDSMEHTVEALQQIFPDRLPADGGVSEIQSIELYIGYFDENTDGKVRIERAGEVYGVPVQSVQDRMEGEETPAQEADGGGEMTGREDSSSGDRFAVYITDRAEIEELGAMLSFVNNYQNESIFQSGSVSVKVTMKDGEERIGYLPKGALPEKYILRFGEL